MKKNEKLIIILFIVVGVLLFGFLGFRIYQDFINVTSVNKEIDSIEFYGYSLSDSDTDLYKDTFKELSKVLNTKPLDYSEYAEMISKMFIIDLFTLNNKLTSTDIGGLDFIHNDLKDNFKENMGLSMYNFIESNLNGTRTQELPEVSEVIVEDVFETKYTYNEVEYEAYLVTASWSYVKDLGYQDSIKLTLIKDNDMLYIVKGD